MTNKKLPISLPEHGFAQTCYSVHIADIKMPTSNAYAKKHVLALKRFSEIIKMRQKTIVVLKWLNSLKNVISNVDNLLKGSGQQPLTQASFCKNVYVGAYYLDKRVRMLVPRIIYMISHMDTCQLKWKRFWRARETKLSQ